MLPGPTYAVGSVNAGWVRVRSPNVGGPKRTLRAITW